MENTKTVKALKKQLVAAIAMVLVAAIALGSSTYAWFVSNNKVTGTTTTISAQSNSAYLVIDSETTSASSKATKALEGENAELYPAKIVKTGSDAVWKSAYAETTSEATMKEGTEFQIGDGTATNAEKLGYAKLNTFYIGTGGYDGEFSDLKIDKVEVKVAATDENKGLGNALRILAVNHDTGAWQVWSATGELLQSGAKSGEALASTVKKGSDVVIDVYLYYDGDDANVYSDNLKKISADAGNNGVTITFSATPKEYGATAGN